MLVKHQTPSSLPWNCLVKCYRSQHVTQWISKLLIELQVAGTNCLNIGKWLQLSPNPVWRFLCSLLHFSENLYIPRFMLIMFSLEFICVFIYFLISSLPFWALQKKSLSMNSAVNKLKALRSLKPCFISVWSTHHDQIHVSWIQMQSALVCLDKSPP